MAGEVQTCIVFNVETNTCTEQAWMPAPHLLPELSIADAFVIGSAYAGLMGYCYAWNRLEKFVRGAR